MMTKISYSGYRFPPEIIQQAWLYVRFTLSFRDTNGNVVLPSFKPDPKIIQAIAGGTAPAGLTVSRLTQALPHAWTAQEQMLGLS
jgi:hypothetical protein